MEDDFAEAYVLARIDEATCIGCTLCIAACPVDAIAGAQGLMHTVIADYCIGCELCVPPCPVDCIDMVPARRAWTAADAQAAKRRAKAQKKRTTEQTPPKTSAERRAIIAAILKK
jgi:H+/Na+-translocating ferredoxin:NAD+ oxidoreductase subunit B